MNHRLFLTTFALLNFILALSSGFVLTIALINLNISELMFSPTFFILEILFWASAFITLLLQALYLRLRILNSTWQIKTWAQKVLLFAHLILILFVCHYGLRGIRLEASFATTFWNLNVLKIAVITALTLFFILANIGLLYPKGVVKKWQLLRK